MQIDRQTGIDWIDRALSLALDSVHQNEAGILDVAVNVPALDIIVPIFEAHEDLQACLNSLINHTDAKHRIWLFDDASHDERISRLGHSLSESDSRFRYVRQPHNLGFVANTNQALAETTRDVVVLNSDTRVTPQWLERMWRCARSAERVGVVSPLSNNATLLSVTRSEHLAADQIDSVAKAVAATATAGPVAVPTAVGFCMLIRRKLLDTIGLFDTAFSPGYGEEVDFCLRAWAAGFRVLACTDAFVYHRGQASFGRQDNKSWRDANERLLASRWPSYEAITRGWWRNNPLRCQIERLSARHRTKPLIVHLLHRWHTPGGTEIVTRRLISKLNDEFEHLVIVPGRGGEHWADASVHPVASGVELMVWNGDYLDQDWRILGEPAGLCNPWLDGLLAKVLSASGARILHIHHLFGWGTLMPALIARALHIEVVLSLHCFHYLCPDYNQIGVDGNPCGKPLVETSTECIDCLLPRLASASDNRRVRLEQYLSARRSLVRQVVHGASRLTAPSKFLRGRISRALGASLDRRIELVPHGIDAPTKPEPRNAEGPLVVAYLGGLKRLKGSRTLLAAAARLPDDLPIEIRLYGPDGESARANRRMPDNCSWKGVYGPADVARIVQAADIIVVPSIFEESFSLTVSEAWAGGRPVIASAHAALAERVEDGFNGWLFPADDDDALAHRLAWLIEPEGRSALAAMQDRLLHAACQPGTDFSVAYRRIYSDLIGLPAAALATTGRPRHHDIAPAQIQAELEGSQVKLKSLLSASFRIPTKLAIAAPRLAAWIQPQSDAPPGSQAQTLEALAQCPGITEIVYGAAGEASFLARLRRLRAPWVWLLRAGEQPLPEAIAAVRARLARAGQDRVFYFDHLHITGDGRLHGQVFKPAWDPWLAATSSDFDCGWMIERTLLIDAVAQNPSPDAWPVNALLADHSDLIPTHVPIPITARPDWTLSAAGTDIIDRRASVGLESGRPSRPLPPVVVIDSARRGDLQTTLYSLVQLPEPPTEVIVCSDRRPPPGPWPGQWQWLKPGDFGPSPAAVTLALLRAGIALSDPDAVCRHLPCLDDDQVAALGFAVATRTGGSLGAGRVAGHAHDRLPSQAPWPDGLRDSSAVLRRVSALSFDITLINRRLISAKLAQALINTEPSGAPDLDDSPVMLASSQPVAHFPDRPPRLQNLNSARSDPFFSPRLSLSHSSWRPDPFASQVSVVSGGGLKVVALTPDHWASSHYRLRQPLAALHERGDIDPPIIISTEQQALPNHAEWQRLAAQVLIVHHCFDDQVIALFQSMTPANRPRLIYLLDDLLTELPDYNPFRQQQRPDLPEKLAWHLKHADLLIASTRELAQAFGDYGCPVRVIENALPNQPWDTVAQTEPSIPSTRPRVGWAGAQQHEGDLRLLKSVVRATAEQVDWVVFGMCPDYLRPWVREIQPAVRFSDYPQTLSNLGVQIAVAPLVDNSFNRCKSALKLLEWGRLGVPVIASDLPPYLQAPIIRVDASPQAWIDAINHYVSQPQQAAADGAILQQWVLARHRLALRLDDWHDALAGTARAPDRSVATCGLLDP